MNAFELQAFRHIFALSVEECATYIALDGNVSAWQQWENGERDIPVNIVLRCTEMKVKRKLRINAIIEKINNRIGNNTMRFFPDLTSFQAVYHSDHFLDWKIYQSTAVELYAHDLERLC
ncbi:MAG: YdiL family protein [Citrobacter sp.]|uniref:DUF1870 family protein n=1 Tax=Citrobacter tructae TaxID=2562449 RepID=A0ABX5T9Q8_9ENTR|nr:YdiL family protein [Citrobacter tructae]QBX83227.1 DUF1870 family protein [Citrobacter tructae]